MRVKLLGLIKVVKQLALGDEFFGSAQFRNSTVVQHENSIGILHGRQPMGDSNSRSSVLRVIDRFLNFFLCQSI